MSSVLTGFLELTKSVGKREAHDVSFTDVFEYGGFPFSQNIKSVTKIAVFSEKNEQDAAVIVGLSVTYKLADKTTPTANHGLVHADKLGEFSISDNQLLVGAYGQLKAPDQPTSGRVASISFVLFDKSTAHLVVKGPFQGSDVGLGEVFATFGEIIAFQGTRTDNDGLTSLGFTLASPLA